MLRNIPGSDTSDDDEDATLSPSIHQSSVEVHDSSGNYGNPRRPARLTLANETINGDLSSDEEEAPAKPTRKTRADGIQSEAPGEEMGAVAGVSNPTFYDDHFGSDDENQSEGDGSCEDVSSASEADDSEGSLEVPAAGLAEVRVLNTSNPGEPEGRKGAEIV